MTSHGTDFGHSILDYLVRHPDAKDTLKGVLTWWIPTVPHDERNEQAVVKALEDLVTRGWVLKRDTSTQPIYGLNRTHLEDIRKFLAQGRPAD